MMCFLQQNSKPARSLCKVPDLAVLIRLSGLSRLSMVVARITIRLGAGNSVRLHVVDFYALLAILAQESQHLG